MSVIAEPVGDSKVGYTPLLVERRFDGARIVDELLKARDTFRLF